MPTNYSTISAGSSAAISLAAGSILRLSGDGTAQLAPPGAPGTDTVQRALSANSAFGPYSVAATVNVSATSTGNGVRYYTQASGDAAPPGAAQSGADSLGSVAANSTYTRSQLIALAEANALTIGTIYRTSDGLMAQALTERYLQPQGPWYIDGRRYSVGSATSATDLAYTMLPPLAPNAQVDIYHLWQMDGTNVTKRGRVYIDGTLGGGVSGASAIYTRNFTDTNVQVNQYSRMTNRNDASSQMCLTIGDSSAFGASTSALTTLSVSTNTSKLLRAMGETSKNSGAPVSISTLTRVGTLATATSTAHGLSTGDYVGIFGATPSGFNVDPAQVTVVDANTFTYNLASDPGSNATGTLTFQKYVNLALVSFRVNIFQGL